MPYNLQGRNVLVTGASKLDGLGACITNKFAAEKCNVAIHYYTSKEGAEQVAKNIEKDYGVKTLLVHGNLATREGCESVVKEARDGLNGLDVLVSNAGYTKFPELGKEGANFGDFDFMTEEDWDKSWAVNCKANLHLLRAALPTFKANRDGGVFLVTSSIAGVAAMGSTMAYSVTKAAGLHLVKCLASTQGPKVRVNAILPGLLLTEWGQKFPKDIQQQICQKAYLGKATDLDDCADAFVAAAKNSSMTGQNIQIDSGFAMPGRAS